MKISIVTFFSLLLACGNSPCDQYCAAACTKGTACGVTIHGAPVGGGQACEDSCSKDAAAIGFTDAQCETAKAKIGTMTCADFVAYLNTYGR